MFNSKYRNVKFKDENGIKWDSKKEYKRYLELKEREKKGEISNLKRQVTYILIPRQTDENGKFLHHPTKYIADFVYTDNATGKEIVEDTKGMRTEIYKLKKKLMYWQYKIEIKEVWWKVFKDIEGFEGLYKISNQGIVLSLNYNHTGKEKILKPAKRKDGYLQVGLRKQGKQKRYLIHRLVAQAFLPNPENLPEVNHRDEDKTNNHVTNLEWCTRLYNNNYGTRNQRVAESNANHPKTSKKVMCLETGVIYPSTNEVRRQLGFAQGHISSVCNGKRNTAYGYTWKYVS